MQILTPTGYRPIAQCAVGDSVCAFDRVMGTPIVNTIDGIQWVDAAEWARWWQVEPEIPPFRFFKINGTWVLNSEQSIWRNDDNVCHAKHLVVGDVIFDDADQDVTITSIEEVSLDGWYRFDISGDHSYIVDGLTLHNASRFWVGGTGTWDSSTTTHWASGTGGAGGQSVPGSADVVTFDGNSGAPVVTLNFGGTITIQSFTMTGTGTFTGTFDNSVNNNNMTLSAAAGFSGSGSGTRTINLGNATYTLTGSGNTLWNFTTVTNLTLNAGSSTITFSGSTTGSKSFLGGGKTYGTVNLSANTGAAFWQITGANTFGTLNITAPAYVQFPQLATTTISNALSINGASGSMIGLFSGSPSSSATIAAAAGSTASWVSLRDITFTGSPVAVDCIDLGNNSGITMNPPSGLAPPPMMVCRGTPY